MGYYFEWICTWKRLVYLHGDKDTENLFGLTILHIVFWFRARAQARGFPKISWDHLRGPEGFKAERFTASKIFEMPRGISVKLIVIRIGRNCGWASGCSRRQIGRKYSASNDSLRKSSRLSIETRKSSSSRGDCRTVSLGNQLEQFSIVFCSCQNTFVWTSSMKSLLFIILVPKLCCSLL